MVKKNLSQRELLQYQRDCIRCAVESLSVNYEKKRKTLNDSETYMQLSALEQKLRHHESNNFHLKECQSSQISTDLTKTDSYII
jgi:intraflagellar transport protein 74